MTDPTPQPETAPVATPETTAQPAQGLDSKTLAIAVYALYLASLITVTATAIIGVVVAYVFRGDAPEWLKSHYEFQIRTFWGGLIGMVAGFVTLPLLGLGVLVWALTGIWFLIRTVVGLSKALNNQPYPTPNNWLV